MLVKAMLVDLYLRNFPKSLDPQFFTVSPNECTLTLHPLNQHILDRCTLSQFHFSRKQHM